MSYRLLSLFSGFISLILFLFFAYSFLLTGNSSQSELSSMHENMANEIYDPEIGSINSLQALKKNIQIIVEQENLSGIEIPIYIDDLLRKKFMHGSSSINTKGNWLLQVADTILIDELAFSFSAEDVAMHNRAICSQQAILFQELIADFGFEYESVGFNVPLLELKEVSGDKEFNHFASAVKVDNNWYYFDSNLEPIYDRKNHLVYSELLIGQSERLTELYPSYKWAEITEGMIYRSSRNTFPAPTGLLIQQISKVLSFFSWIFFCMLSILFSRLSKVNN
jgi:hypothetical protein